MIYKPVQGNDLPLPWARYPLVKICLPFCAGIGMSVHSFLALSIAGCLCFILSLASKLLHDKVKTNFKYSTWIAALMLTFWFCAGFLWSGLNNEYFRSGHFRHLISEKSEWHCRIYLVEEKDRYWDCYSNVLEKLGKDFSLKTRGKCLLRINKEINYSPFAGDGLLAKFHFIVPEGPSAPYDYDWKKQLARRNIHFISYLDSLNYSIKYRAQPSFFDRARSKTDQIIFSLIPSDRDYPVASAMILGLRKKMDPELYRAYSATGAVHVLAVSGLHVGIIAQIFQFLFGFIRWKSKWKNVIVSGFVLIIIWMYTILTGATPSIMRSALMFSLFILARLRYKQVASLNILAGTAFILLLINPNDIFNIGFQLSFAAMAGIFILYEPIRTLIPHTNKVLETLWKAVSISTAAQLFIYPIVGYHFHQFAFYFWLTGLISTPFSYIILGGGILAIPLFNINETLGHLAAVPLKYAVKWMNDIIAFVYQMPFGRMTGWWPTLIELCLLIAISVLLGYLYYKRSLQALKLVLVTIIVFFVTMIVQEYLDVNRSEIIISKNRGSALAWVKAQKNIFKLGSDSSIQIPFNYLERFNLSYKNIIMLNANEKITVGNRLLLTNQSVEFGADYYTILIQNQDSIKPLNNLTTTLILGNPFIDLHKINLSSIRKVIAFSSNSKWSISNQSYCIENNIPYYTITASNIRIRLK